MLLVGGMISLHCQQRWALLRNKISETINKYLVLSFTSPEEEFSVLGKYVGVVRIQQLVSLHKVISIFCSLKEYNWSENLIFISMIGQRPIPKDVKIGALIHDDSIIDHHSL